MQAKVMAGQEKMANGLERDVISLITLQNGRKLDFSGLVVVVALLPKKLQLYEMPFLPNKKSKNSRNSTDL